MRIGRRHGQPADLDGARPGWLPLGYILALGEAVLLVLIVAHGGPTFGAPPPAPSLVASGGQVARTLPRPHVPTTTTTAPTPTTVPSTPVVTVPPVPTTTPPTPPTPAVAATRGILPPAVPADNIAPDPNFLQSCSGSAYDDSSSCTGATLQAIANARAGEGLAPMTLPTNWAQLTPAEQLFVATNLERTARGLPALTAMASALDQAADQGATQNDDPAPPAGFPFTEWGSNWAGAVGNPLEAIYLWMYDDGVGSANVDCTASNRSGCWGHRKNILLGLACHECLMGTAWAPGGYSGDPSLTELLVDTSGSVTLAFTWQQETAYLP